MSADRFSQLCLESVGRTSFLTPADICTITGRAIKTILNDKGKGLLAPISSLCKNPTYDAIEVYMYLVKIGQIELPKLAKAA